MSVFESGLDFGFEVEIVSFGEVDAVVGVTAGVPVVILDGFPGVGVFGFEPHDEGTIGGAEP